MNDTMVTVVGNVVDSPRRVNVAGGGAVTNFRMASTARRFDAASEAYVDVSTLWIDVECWNTLGSNVSGSLCKGDPVIVRGTLRTDSWESDAGRRSKPQIRAYAVGLDLAKGRAVFKRDRSERAAESAGSAGTAVAGADTGPAGGEGLDDHPAQAELMHGRDYVGAGETLGSMDDPDLSQPAHA